MLKAVIDVNIFCSNDARLVCSAAEAVFNQQML